MSILDLRTASREVLRLVEGYFWVNWTNQAGERLQDQPEWLQFKELVATTPNPAAAHSPTANDQ